MTGEALIVSGKRVLGKSDSHTKVLTGVLPRALGLKSARAGRLRISPLEASIPPWVGR